MSEEKKLLPSFHFRMTAIEKKLDRIIELMEKSVTGNEIRVSLDNTLLGIKSRQRDLTEPVITNLDGFEDKGSYAIHRSIESEIEEMTKEVLDKINYSDGNNFISIGNKGFEKSNIGSFCVYEEDKKLYCVINMKSGGWEQVNLKGL